MINVLRVLTLRVPEELLRRLDAYTTQVQAASPTWLRRADVLRMLLGQRIELQVEEQRHRLLTEVAMAQGRKEGQAEKSIASIYISSRSRTSCQPSQDG